MTKPVAIRLATPDDIDEMLPHVRDPDREELWAAGLYTPDYALRTGLSSSDRTWTARIQGEIVAMFGISAGSLIGGIGVPWMIGTHAIDRHSASFLRRSRGALMMAAARYDYLVNFVDDRNHAAIRWLEWLGFKIEDPQPLGPFRLPFRRFWMRTAGGMIDV